MIWKKALAGQPVVLRNGTKAYVRHHETELSPNYPLQGYREHRLNHPSAAWTKTGRSYTDPATESDCDILGMWVEPAVFKHWDALDPKWNFIAADEDGEVWVFITKPAKSETDWSADGLGTCSRVTDLFNFEYTDWEHSLVERPTDS